DDCHRRRGRFVPCRYFPGRCPTEIGFNGDAGGGAGLLARCSRQPNRIPSISQRAPEERFWRYGYGAIMNAAFADRAPRRLPFAGKVAAATVADASSTVGPALSPSAVDPCGGGSAAADADAWIARIEHAITPAAPQREVLEQLRSALMQAIERITAACPSPPPATPTERLQAIQDRIGAMLATLLTIRQPFESFYSSLTQEQHWRLNSDSDAREIEARSRDRRSEK